MARRKTSAMGMSIGYVIGIAKRSLSASEISAEELSAWATDHEIGQVCFPLGLDVEQAEYILSLDPDTDTKDIALRQTYDRDDDDEHDANGLANRERSGTGN